MNNYERYAVYYAPRGKTPLGFFGNHWLGGNPETGEVYLRSDISGLTANQIEKNTKSPSRYGFHGTLKSPFALKEGRAVEALDQSMSLLCRQLSPVQTGPLALKSIGRFLALVPTGDLSGLSALAESCVRSLDGMRAEESEERQATRREKGLSERQETYLKRWGYPYVMDEFRFHLTLTDPLDTETQRVFTMALQEKVTDICADPFVIDQICLFGDPGGGAPFKLLKRYDI